MPPEMEREEIEEPVLSLEEPPTPSAEVGDSISDDDQLSSLRLWFFRYLYITWRFIFCYRTVFI